MSRARDGWAQQYLVDELNIACVEPRCALRDATCPAGYTNSATLTGVGPFTSTNRYDDLPLPPMTRLQNITGRPYLGALLCSGGTIEEITAFVDTQLEDRGFHYVGSTGCPASGGLGAQCWVAGTPASFEFTFSIASATGWFISFQNPDKLG